MIQDAHGVEVDAGRQERIALARLGADDGGEVHDHVGLAHDARHEGFVTHITLNEFKCRGGTEMKERLLADAVHQVVNGLDAIASIEEMFAQDAAEIAECAGDEHAFRHGTFPGVK